MKKTILYILLDSIFVILFNTIFFMVGGADHPASVWISYGFIHFAYLMVLLTPMLTKNAGGGVGTMGMAVASVSSVYFLAEFFIGLLFMLISPDSYKAALLIQMILAGIYAILLIVNILANDATAASTEVRQMELQYVKMGAMKIKAVMGGVEDQALLKKLEAAYDLIHASQVKTNIAVRNLELEIMDLIDSLDDQVLAGSLETAGATVNRITKLANERNMQLKLLR